MTWDDTQGETLSPRVRCEHCASTGGARRAQNCALYTSRVLCGVRAIVRNVLKHVHVVRKDVRSAVAIFCVS